MGEEVLTKTLSLSDSIYLVLLVAVSLAFWRLLMYAFKQNREAFRKNEEREQRYIGVIESQAKSLQNIESDVRDIKQKIFK